MGISRLAAATVVVMALLANPVNAKGRCMGQDRTYQVGNGFLNGQALRDMSDESLSSYTMGFVDALVIGALFGMTDGCREEISRCTAKRSNKQLVAIVRKFLKENPERWHERANILLFGALLQRCIYEKGAP